MVVFDTDPDLGKVIAQRKLFCFGAAPIRNISDIEFAAGGRKLSTLCGFFFTSAAPSRYPNFFIQFGTKLRSKKFRQNVRPPMWRVAKQISKTELHVLDKQAVLAQYGFDVDKFFQSDLFARSVPKFEATVKRGLDKEIPAFMAAREAGRAAMAKRAGADSYDVDGYDVDSVAADVRRYAQSISAQLPYVKNRACEDSFYKLVDFVQRSEACESAEDEPDEKLDAAIEAEMSKIYN